MTASFDTAPLRGQSLRGRPVHERCMPVNQGNQPLLRRRGGGGLATALPSGQTGEIFRPEEFRRTDHPVCGASEASRLFINAAATPPFKEGNVSALKQSVNSFTRSDAVGYVMTLASRANSAAQRRQEPSPGRKPWVVVTT